MELHHNVESSLARTLAALDEVLDKRRRGMHIMELNGYVSTVTLGLRRPPADGITAHEESEPEIFSSQKQNQNLSKTSFAKR